MKDKMKILLCSVSLEEKGGVSNYVRLILEHYPKEKYLIDHFVEGHVSKSMKIFYPFVIFIQLLKFKEKLRRFDPDVIHINPSLAWVAILRDYLFARYARKKGFSVIFCVGGWDTSIAQHFHSKNILSRLFYRIFNTPDCIIVLASSFKNDLIKLGIDTKKIRLTTMMVESDRFRPVDKMFKPPFTLLFCSRIEKLKGIYQLLEAFQLVLQKYPDTRLIYVGNGSEFHALNEKINDIKLGEKVKCVGYKAGAEKIRFYTQSDMMILPSFTEGFPNVYCEALAAGLPFIGTHVGGLIDVFQEGKQGVVIHSLPPAPEEIYEKIVELMENPGLMKQISENNLREAQEQYDVKVVIAKLDTLYQEIFHQKGKHV